MMVSIKIVAVALIAMSCNCFGAQLRSIYGINRGDAAIPTPQLIQPYPQDMTPVVVTNAMGLADPATLANPIIVQINLVGIFMPGMLDPQYIDDILYHLNNPPLLDFNIVGLLLNVDSPGGSDSDQMYALLKEFIDRRSLPVVAFCESISFSAGYMLSCAADYIMASKLAILGNVGTLLSKTWLNYKDTFLQETELETSDFSESKLLVNFSPNWKILRRGTWYDRGLPIEPWSENEFEALELWLDEDYAGFVKLVSDARPKLTPEILIDKLGAKIFAPTSALELGYIDALSATRSDAISKIVELAGCGPNYRVIELRYNQ